MTVPMLAHRVACRRFGDAPIDRRLLSRAAFRLSTFVLLLASAAPAHASDDVAANLILPGQGVLGRFDQRGGENIYSAICQGCHMPDAHGAKGAAEYPALAANPRLAPAPYPAAMVLNGRRAMPAFGNSLSDDQIAEVVNYVRSHFGNNYTDAIVPEDVARLRARSTAESR